jgi:UDP-glucose 4-epimerase
VLVNITVTGGAGFVGRRVALAAAAAGHRVLVADQRPVSLPQVESRVVDLRHDADTLAALAKADAVIHLAGPVVGTFRSTPAAASILQHTGTATVLEACRHHQIPRVAIASSFYVYTGAAPERHVVDETTPLALDRMDLFGAAKFHAERLAAEYADRYELTVRCLRFGSIYGPSPDGTNAVTNLLAEALTTGVLDLWGDPDRPNQYVHVDDIAQGCLAALGLENGERIYNLTNPQVTTTGQLAEHIAELTGATITYSPDRPSGPQFPYQATNRANRDLAWAPRALSPDVVAELAGGTIRSRQSA